MEKKISRPLLLTGLILSLVSFVILTLSGLVTIIAVLSAGIVGNAETQMILITALFITLIIVAFAICGVVFSSISLSRWNLPAKKFDEKKGLITTTFVFAVITAVLELIGLFTAFDILTLFMLIVSIVSAVFIMIDRCKNAKYLKQAEQEEKQPEAEVVTEKSEIAEEKKQEIEKSDE